MKENQNLLTIGSAADRFHAELLVGMLKNNGIEAFLLDKRSETLLIGEVEILVAQQDAATAAALIAQRPTECITD